MSRGLAAIAALLGALSIASCSSGSSSGEGAPGIDAAAGATSGSGGAGNRGGTTNTGGATDSGRRADVVTSNALGAACNADADCGGGLVCAKATDSVFFGRGGPPSGYCTLSCNPPGDANCPAMGGSCADLALNPTDPPAPYCLRPCAFGTTDALKCLARSDVGCVVVDQTTMQGVCLPICSQDSQCPAGRRCDPLLALCVDAPTAGDPLGNHCSADPDAAATCAGTCIAIGSATMLAGSICSRRCVTGPLESCDWVGAGVSLAGARHGVCAFSSSMAAGDLGFCAELCDTVSDCHDTVDRAPICDMSFSAVVGHGICSWGAPLADAGNSSGDARDARADGRD